MTDFDDLQKRMIASGEALTASPDELARIRATVMATAVQAPGRSRGWRLIAAAAAAVLLLAGVSMAAASGPGEPLYQLRLAIERVFSPADGETDVFGQLDRRLAEARAASDAGDRAGLGAALGAYREVISQLDPTSIDATDDALDQLDRQLIALRQLLTEVADEQDVVSEVIAATEEARDALAGVPSSSPPASLPASPPARSDEPSHPGP